jgi:hypothetical protein
MGDPTWGKRMFRRAQGWEGVIEGFEIKRNVESIGRQRLSSHG